MTYLFCYIHCFVVFFLYFENFKKKDLFSNALIFLISRFFFNFIKTTFTDLVVVAIILAWYSLFTFFHIKYYFLLTFNF